MIHALALTCGSIPISAAYLAGEGRKDGSLVLLLYILVVSAFMAWFSLPYIEWLPDASAM